MDSLIITNIFCDDYFVSVMKYLHKNMFTGHKISENWITLKVNSENIMTETI